MSAPGSFDIAKAAEKVSDDDPHGWIQWKGTDVCIDLHCICGTLGHFDGYSMYQVVCEDCGQHYAVGSNVVLAPMSDEQVAAARTEYPGVTFHGFSDDED